MKPPKIARSADLLCDFVSSARILRNSRQSEAVRSSGTAMARKAMRDNATCQKPVAKNQALKSPVRTDHSSAASKYRQKTVKEPTIADGDRRPSAFVPKMDSEIPIRLIQRPSLPLLVG